MSGPCRRRLAVGKTPELASTINDGSSLVVEVSTGLFGFEGRVGFFATDIRDFFTTAFFAGADLPGDAVFAFFTTVFFAGADLPEDTVTAFFFSVDVVFVLAFAAGFALAAFLTTGVFAFFAGVVAGLAFFDTAFFVLALPAGLAAVLFFFAALVLSAFLISLIISSFFIDEATLAFFRLASRINSGLVSFE